MLCALLRYLCRCQQCETYLGIVVKSPIVYSDFNQIWSVPRDCNKNPPVQNFIKTRPVGAALLIAEQKDGEHDEGNSRFRLVTRKRLNP